jgi:hypothetical protein
MIMPENRVEDLEKKTFALEVDTDSLATLLEALCGLLCLSTWDEETESFDDWVNRTLAEIKARR